jgi:hypothetical protein
MRCRGGAEITGDDTNLLSYSSTSTLESVNMGDELPGARFCKIQKIQNLNFRKIREKY